MSDLCRDWRGFLNGPMNAIAFLKAVQGITQMSAYHLHGWLAKHIHMLDDVYRAYLYSG